MDLTRKQKTTKYICCCLLILLADLLQNVSGLLPEIGGARCFLLIPAVVILSFGEDEIKAALLGLFAGFLWDMSSAVHMGFNCIFFSTICFISAALVSHLIRDTFITNMLVSVTAIILYCLTYWLCFIVIKGVEGGEGTLLSFFLPCAVYTTVITPIVYIIYKPIKKRLKNQKAEK